MKTLARASDKTELLSRLRTLRPTSVRRWGRMSVHQMVCHLGDAFCMGLGERAVTLDTSLIKRTLVKWVALYAPFPWPPGIPTSLAIDQERGEGTTPSDFATDVARVESLIEAFTSPDARLARQLHPYFARMSDADWLRWGYAHCDHHLRQFGA